MSGTHALIGVMQDGRFVTDYSPSCLMNTRLSKESGVPVWNSTKYRAYLQANGLDHITKTYQQKPCGPSACKDHGASIPHIAKPPPIQPPWNTHPVQPE